MGENTSSGEKWGMQGKKETEDYGKNSETGKRQRRGLDLVDLVGYHRAGDHNLKHQYLVECLALPGPGQWRPILDKTSALWWLRRLARNTARATASWTRSRESESCLEHHESHTGAAYSKFQSWANQTETQVLNYYPGQKKEPSSRFAARRTLFHVWYHARSGEISAGQVRSATVCDFCPALIAPDRAWYHTWNSVLLAANLEDGSFFWPG